MTRPAGREHIPIYPRGFIAIRIVQLVLAIIVMGLSAYSVYYLSYDGNALILAVAVMNVVDSVYHLVAEFAAPVIYNYWAVLGLDIFFVIMWLCSFALLAARIAPYYQYINGYAEYDAFGDVVTVGLTDTEKAWLNTQAAAAALGGVEFVLFIVALVICSIRLHRHRAEGLHCMPGAPRTVPGSEKPAPGLAYQQQQQQQPPYQQQPQPQPVLSYQPVPVAVQAQPQTMYAPQPQQQQQPVFYSQAAAAAPQPPQSPAPTVAPLVPQPTGGTVGTAGGQVVVGQGQQPQPQPHPGYPAQFPGN